MDHCMSRLTQCIRVQAGSGQVLLFSCFPWLVHSVNIGDSPAVELALLGTYVVNHGQRDDEYAFSVRINGATNQRSKQSSVKNDVLNYVEACVTLFWDVQFSEFSITSNLHFILGLDKSLAKPQNSDWAEVAKS